MQVSFKQTMTRQNAVALVADSTCDLSAMLIEQHQIGIVPLYILWGTESYRDGFEMDAPTFYARLDSSEQNKHPAPIKTSQPAPEAFADVYQQAHDTQQAEAVVCMTLSQKLSGTWNSAQKATRLVDFPVHVVDSTSVSFGLTVLSAARARDRGASAEEIAQVARTVGQQSQIFVVLNTLDYLFRGGRISGTQRMVGSMLSIKPLLSIHDGEVAIADRVRTHKRAMARLVELARCIDDKPGTLRLAVMDGGVRAEGDEVAAELQAALHPSELLRGTLSPVLGVHGGPGVIGFIAVPTALG